MTSFFFFFIFFRPISAEEATAAVDQSEDRPSYTPTHTTKEAANGRLSLSTVSLTVCVCVCVAHRLLR